MLRVAQKATVLLVMMAASIAAAASVLDRVVAAGQPAPGGGTFERFSVESQPIVAPVNSRGQVAFFASLLRNRASEGLFLGRGARIGKVVLDGDPAPGGGTFSGFGKHPVP